MECGSAHSTIIGRFFRTDSAPKLAAMVESDSAICEIYRDEMLRIYIRSAAADAVLRTPSPFVFPKMHKRRDGQVPARRWIAAACIPQASPRTADSPCAASPSP